MLRRYRKNKRLSSDFARRLSSDFLSDFAYKGVSENGNALFACDFGATLKAVQLLRLCDYEATMRRYMPPNAYAREKQGQNSPKSGRKTAPKTRPKAHGATRKSYFYRSARSAAALQALNLQPV